MAIEAIEAIGWIAWLRRWAAQHLTFLSPRRSLDGASGYASAWLAMATYRARSPGGGVPMSDSTGRGSMLAKP